MKQNDTSWNKLEEIKDEMLGQTSNVRARTAIRNVWTAIQHLNSANIPITIAAVAKYCKGIGGPKEQSIRNNKDNLGRLVRSASDIQILKYSKRYKSSDNIFDRISDPHLAAEIRILIAERDSAMRSVNSLKVAFRRTTAIGIISSEMATEKLSTLEDIANNIKNRPNNSGAFLDHNESKILLSFFQYILDSGHEFDSSTGELFTASGLRVSAGNMLNLWEKLLKIIPKQVLNSATEQFPNLRILSSDSPNISLPGER